MGTQDKEAGSAGRFRRENSAKRGREVQDYYGCARISTRYRGRTLSRGVEIVIPPAPVPTSPSRRPGTPSGRATAAWRRAVALGRECSGPRGRPSGSKSCQWTSSAFFPRETGDTVAGGNGNRVPSPYSGRRGHSGLPGLGGSVEAGEAEVRLGFPGQDREFPDRSHDAPDIGQAVIGHGRSLMSRGSQTAIPPAAHQVHIAQVLLAEVRSRRRNRWSPPVASKAARVAQQGHGLTSGTNSGVPKVSPPSEEMTVHASSARKSTATARSCPTAERKSFAGTPTQVPCRFERLLPRLQPRIRHTPLLARQFPLVAIQKPDGMHGPGRIEFDLGASVGIRWVRRIRFAVHPERRFQRFTAVAAARIKDILTRHPGDVHSAVGGDNRVGDRARAGSVEKRDRAPLPRMRATRSTPQGPDRGTNSRSE